jgi:sarcosine oxidase, subunit beta
MALETDVAIVGAGLVGSSTALALRRRGRSVALVERDFGGSRASGVNFGGVRRQGRSAAQLHLSARAHPIWGSLEKHIGIDGEFVRSGHLKLARSQADLQALADYAQQVESFGLALAILDGPAFRARFPELGPEVIGGSLCPGDGHANPRLVAAGYAHAAKAAGACLLEQCHISGFEHAYSGFRLHADDGREIRSQFLVNAGGAWGGRIAEAFGDDIPVRVDYPTILVTEPLPPLLSVSLGVEGGGFYGRQVARGNLVMGGGFGFSTGNDTARPDPEAISRIGGRGAAILPAMRGAQVIRVWAGIEGYTPDKSPLIGASTSLPGLIHAFGFSGGGFQIAPAVGEILSEIICDGGSPTPLDAFRPDRFQGTRP